MLLRPVPIPIIILIVGLILSPVLSAQTNNVGTSTGDFSISGFRWYSGLSSSFELSHNLSSSGSDRTSRDLAPDSSGRYFSRLFSDTLTFNLSPTYSRINITPITESRFTCYLSGLYTLSSQSEHQIYDYFYRYGQDFATNNHHTSVNNDNSSIFLVTHQSFSKRFFFDHDIYINPELNIAGQANFTVTGSRNAFTNHYVDVYNNNSYTQRTYYDSLQKRGYKNSIIFLNITPSLHFGQGRILECSGAYRAFQLLDDLRSDDCLIRPVRPEDMRTLSILAGTNDISILDSRKRFLDQRSGIAEFLIANGYIRTNDPRAVLVMNDSLQYSYGPTRKNGKSWDLFIDLDYGYEYSKTIEDYQNLDRMTEFSNLTLLTDQSTSSHYFWTNFYKKHSGTLSAGFAWSRYQSLNKTWQWDQAYSFTAMKLTMSRMQSSSIHSWDPEQYRWGYAEEWLIPQATVSLGYFPSTRFNTTVSFNGSGRFGRYNDWYDAWTDRQYGFWNVTGSSYCSLTCNVNPRLRLNLRADISGSIEEQLNSRLFYFPYSDLLKQLGTGIFHTTLSWNAGLSASWRLF